MIALVVRWRGQLVDASGPCLKVDYYENNGRFLFKIPELKTKDELFKIIRCRLQI